MAVEKHELHCHNCNRYVQFELDISIDGNYKIICPNCGHDHYRVCKDGKITDERWGQSQSQQQQQNHYYTTLTGYGVTSSSTSYYQNAASYQQQRTSDPAYIYLRQAWMNTTTTA
ncbi:MAG: hypothetical protein WC455_28270 [Dehalococcoidia bacterium]|jgi:DNA-directed RNA polymerase subunit RPC12/RpoP